MKKVYNLVIGEWIAEDIKIKLGLVYFFEDDNEVMMEVRGLYLLLGLFRIVVVKVAEIWESLNEFLFIIVEVVKCILECIFFEFAVDIIDRGIMLVGGGVLLKGIDILISYEIGIVIYIAVEFFCCVVLGIGCVLENFK